MTLLSVQYRMHPFIRQFPSRHFYNDQLIDGYAPVPYTLTKRLTLTAYDSPPCVKTACASCILAYKLAHVESVCSLRLKSAESTGYIAAWCTLACDCIC